MVTYVRSSRILLCVSYKSVTRFLVITFLFHVISSWNLPDMYHPQRRNFSWVRRKMKIFPIDSIVKTYHFWQCHVGVNTRHCQKLAIFTKIHVVSKSGWFSQRGSMEKFRVFRRVLWYSDSPWSVDYISKVCTLAVGALARYCMLKLPPLSEKNALNMNE